MSKDVLKGNIEAEYELKHKLDEVSKEFQSKNPSFTRKQVEDFKKAFIGYDVDRSGDLDLFEVQQMMEKLGQTKTRAELKDMIAEVDTTGKGTINFKDFLRAMAPEKDVTSGVIEEKPLPLFGKIYQSALAEKATFFEQQMRSAQGKTKEEQEAEIKAGAAQRKLERQRAKEEKDAKAAEEAKQKEQAEKRAAMKAKAAAFEGGKK